MHWNRAIIYRSIYWSPEIPVFKHCKGGLYRANAYHDTTYSSTNKAYRPVASNGGSGGGGLPPFPSPFPSPFF